jgi:16S rRNA (cytidine1402-2'-O)-methyltransferase
MTGILYLVATPIGNLGDMSFRAVETLKQVDFIACEDTRHTQKLLNHYSIANKLISYHEHNEAARSDELVEKMSAGNSVAVVTDAGTPGISDPGYRLVRRAIEAGIRVESIPGPAAFVNAAVISGLPTDSIFFGGFLPSKKGERGRRLMEVANIPATIVFYEAPHRLAASLVDCAEVLGPRPAAIVRELTKLHEDVVRGDLVALADHFRDGSVKGEIVIVIDRGSEATAGTAERVSLAERVFELEGSGVDRREALKTAAKEFRVSRSEAYRLVQSAKKI